MIIFLQYASSVCKLSLRDYNYDCHDKMWDMDKIEASTCSLLIMKLDNIILLLPRCLPTPQTSLLTCLSMPQTSQLTYVTTTLTINHARAQPSLRPLTAPSPTQHPLTYLTHNRTHLSPPSKKTPENQPLAQNQRYTSVGTSNAKIYLGMAWHGTPPVSSASVQACEKRKPWLRKASSQKSETALPPQIVIARARLQKGPPG